MKLTQETKQAILDAHNDKTNRTHDIADAFGITTYTLLKVVLEMGGQPRRPNAMGKRDGNKKKLCPKCKTLITIKGAKFCYICGSDIREQKDLLIEKNSLLLKLLLTIPETNRDEFQKTILETIDYLKNEKGN